MNTIGQLADWLLSRESMTNKKLQKMAYYSVAWGYALFGKKIFMDDEFEAWVHGPVSPVLYHEFKGNGWNPIPNEDIEKPNFDKEIVDLLESVWLTYGDETGNALEALTHEEDPWRNARKGYSSDQSCNNIIDPEDMEKYYKSIYIGD